MTSQNRGHVCEIFFLLRIRQESGRRKRLQILDNREKSNLSIRRERETSASPLIERCDFSRCSSICSRFRRPDSLRMRRRTKISRKWPRFWDVKITYLSVNISTISERGDFFWQNPGLETKDLMSRKRLPAAARGMGAKRLVRSPGTRAGA